MTLYALGLIGVVIAMAVEVQREQEAARRLLLGRARARALDEGNRCPYCLDGLEEEDGARIRCPDCGTRHHTECWREHGACSVHGCGRVYAAADEEDEEDEIGYIAEGSEAPELAPRG